ncbi:MAG TPA: alpha/beta hydrolase [Thermoanaerobaculia bacterium]|jgi:pimeloyl-ACP methyl ester carboxylesterase
MRTILWIHGFPLSSAIFDPQLSIGGAQHLTFDLPGFGLSPARAEELTMDDYARMAIDVLDANGVERATLAGFSMGGYVAFAAARLAPERIDGLILLDTRETADTDEARKGRFDSIEKVRAEGVRPIVESMLPKMLTKSAPPEMVERVREIMMSSSPEGTIAALRAMAGRGDSSELLPTLNVPVLVVVGAEDAITPPSDAQRMVAGLPKARLVTVDGAAHLANVEKSAEVNRAIEEYLRGR